MTIENTLFNSLCPFTIFVLRYFLILSSLFSNKFHQVGLVKFYQKCWRFEEIFLLLIFSIIFKWSFPKKGSPPVKCIHSTVDKLMDFQTSFTPKALLNFEVVMDQNFLSKFTGLILKIIYLKKTFETQISIKILFKILFRRLSIHLNYKRQ